MSIFSSIGNFFSKAAHSVENAVSKVFSGVGGKSQTSSAYTAATSALNSLPKNMSIAPNISTPQGPGYAAPGSGSVVLLKNGRPTGSVSTPSGGFTPVPSSPTTVRAGSSPIYSGGGSTYSPTLMSFASSSPTTLSAGATPSGTSNLTSTSGGTNFSSINSGSMSSTPTVTMPSRPTYSDPGKINNGGIASTLSQTHTYDPETNSFTDKTDNPEDKLAQFRASAEKLLENDIPQKENVLDDPAIVAQQAEVNARKQEVNNYTAQLNSIVANQNADLLKVRGTDSKEGVTEAVYGGQEAEINREAAIKALPIQAQISAAQGNQQLAQDYLTQLTTWKTQEVDNNYNYRKSLYDSISSFVTGEEKTQLDKLNTENDRAYQETRDNVSLQDSWAKYAAEQGHQGLIGAITALDTSAPDFRQALGNIASQITPKATAEDEANIVGSKLNAAKGEDGYTDPNLYANLRSTSKMTATDFDNRYGYLVNPESRGRLGVGGTATQDFGSLTPADQTKGVNYLLTNGGTKDDLAKFQSDRAFQAWVLGKVQG